MPHRCPSWLGPLLANPLRRLLENPEKLLGGIVREGMTVLEPGCGMGYFTLPVARMAGVRGKVVAVDIQPEMLSGLRKRAEKAGLIDRIQIRTASESGMGLEDLDGRVDLVLALHMVHEVGDQAFFFEEMRNALREEGRLFILEPLLHVSRREMEKSIALAIRTGFEPVERGGGVARRTMLLSKSDRRGERSCP